MKRVLFILAIFGSALASPLFAQSASTAAAIAEKQDIEERFKRMNADLESVQQANQLLQKKIGALEEELRRVREEQTRSANNSTAQEDMKRLAEKIQEVDKKRESDRDLVLAQLKKLGDTLSVPTPRSRKASPPPDEPTKPEKNSSSDRPEKGYSYTIESGDNLGKILKAYNTEFKSKGMKTVSQSQVMAANPNVNWNRLQPGQKIFIPAPQ